MNRPLYVKQPGASLDPRVIAVPARGRSIAFDLPSGTKLLDAIEQGLIAHGFTSGVVELGPVALAPFAYVMPALSKTGENAAFYSEVYRPAGVNRLERGAVTFGRRDGAAFFHCHALWREASGKITGGHILPEETIVAERTTVTALGISGATFTAEPDSETNFNLFGPLATAATSAETDRHVIAVRVRPNQDFHTALEATAAAHGITRARIRGGVGSTIGAELTDGTVITNFATEVFITEGHIAPAPDGSLVATIDAGLVDYTGQIARGRLARGKNPVLMTFELALEAQPS